MAKKQYSGRDGSSSFGAHSAKGMNKATSAIIGTSQKVRSGENSQKTYQHPRVKPNGTQVYYGSQNPGSTDNPYPTKRTKGNK